MAARHFAGETLFSLKNLRKAVAPGEGRGDFQMVRYTALVPHDTVPSTFLVMVASCCSVHGNALNQAIGQTLIWSSPLRCPGFDH